MTNALARQRETTRAAALVTDLNSAGVRLPDDITRGTAHLTGLPGMLDAAFRRPLPTGLLDMDAETLQAVIRQRGIAQAATRDAGIRGLAQELRNALEVELADAIAAEADDVIAQLNEQVEPHALAVHQASKLGITPTTTDAVILRGRDVAEQASAWNTLPQHAAALEHILTLRLSLSAVAGVPPVEDWTRLPHGSLKRAEQESGAKTACLTAGLPWTTGRGEQAWQRWLRFCEASPVGLRTLDATHEARVRPAVLRPAPIALAEGSMTPRRGPTTTDLVEVI